MPPRTKSGRFKKVGTNPVKKNKVKKNKVKKNKVKKNKAKKSSRAMAVYNPKKGKKKVKKNKGKVKKNALARVKKNPGLPLAFERLKNKDLWYTAAHVVVGMGTTGMTSNMLMAMPFARPVRVMPGIGGAVARGVVNGATAGLIAWGGGKLAETLGRGKVAGELLANVSRNLFIGGLAYTIANFFYEVAPAFSSKYMPGVTAPRGLRALPAPVAETANMAGYGPDYKYGYGGMGMVMSPEDLVAGESLAREVNEFSGMNDWMELSGLGQGGAPVPLEDLRGYPGQYGGGMGDWVEVSEGSKLVQEGFAPGAETF